MRPRPTIQTPVTYTPNVQSLAKLFERSRLGLTAKQADLFWRYHQLLRERNEELDLTRLYSFENMVIKLYVDSALVARLHDLPSPLLDLGTGPGLPGIPIKILRPGIQMILLDGRKKRIQFVQEAISELGLKAVEPVQQRIAKSFRLPVKGVITKAVESISDTLHRTRDWLEPSAQVIFMKGPSCDDEIEIAAKEHFSDFDLVRNHAYNIAETPHQRRLVIFHRTEKSPRKKPRHRATATLQAPHRAVTELQGVPSVEPSSKFNALQITSSSNSTFKLLRSVQSSRGIRKSGYALVAGMRHVEDILHHVPEQAVAWITAGPPAPPLNAPDTLEWFQLTPALFREIDPLGAGPPLLMVRLPVIPNWDPTEWPEGCTVFLPFQDPENVGTLIRSAAAFGANRVVLLQEAAHPFHPKSVRAAGGSALFRIPLAFGPSITELDTTQAPIISLSPDGKDIHNFDFPKSFGLLPGLEGPGVPPSLHTTATLRIPMVEEQESLNAAAATAIALYLWSTQSKTKNP